MFDPKILPIKEFIDGHWNSVKVQNINWSGLIRAVSPISSSSGNAGNIAELATEKIFSEDGQICEVPSISGNAMTAVMVRMAGADHLVQTLGLKELSPQALDLLYKGGTLENDSERKKRGKDGTGWALNFTLFNRLNKAFPLLGLLGCAVGSTLQESRLSSSNMRLVCKESEHLIPKELLKDIVVEDSYSYRSTGTHVRLDPKRDVHFKELMEPEPNEKDSDALFKNEPNEKSTDEKKEKSNLLMPFEREYVCAGSYWYWQIWLKHVTTYEFGAFLTAINHWRSHPMVGGRKNRGYGQIEFMLERGSWLPKLEEQFPEAIKNYETHLAKNRDEIIETLTEIA